MAKLFTPITIRNMTLQNRIVLPPMCQYNAIEGVVGPLHYQHYGGFAVSGVGQIVLEATGVLPEGRISDQYLGLWNDTQEAGLKKLVENLNGFGNSKIGIQLHHSGRKGSTARVLKETSPLVERAWTTFAPSAIPFDKGYPTPIELDEAGMTRIKNGFADAARRALNAGFDSIELHCAHGYLLHQFLSPYSNHRTDAYGGSLENRMRFPLEVIAAVRSVWPAEKPLGIRISATEWVEGGFDINEAIIYAKESEKLGIDYVCASSGGNVANTKAPREAGFQVPFAEAIRKNTGLVVRAVGLIVTPELAEEVVTEEKADLVAIGRALLNDSQWVIHAAKRLGASLKYTHHFDRTEPTLLGVSAQVNSLPAVERTS